MKVIHEQAPQTYLIAYEATRAASYLINTFSQVIQELGNPTVLIIT